MRKDYYQILGITPRASQEEIREAYRFKVFALHPDRFPQADTKMRRRAEEELKDINEAYAVLGDLARRAAYDQQFRGSWNQQHSYADVQGHPHRSPQPPGAGPFPLSEVLLRRFTPWVLLLLLLAYLISPIDLVPDALVGPGWVDDLLALLAYLLYTRGRPFSPSR